MPGYGILDANGGRGLLPWAWAVERLTRARNYWIATTCPDGLPHCVPVWGVWLDDDNAFYFSSGTQSRKARNLAANPNCVVCPEDGIAGGFARRRRREDYRRRDDPPLRRGLQSKVPVGLEAGDGARHGPDLRRASAQSDRRRRHARRIPGQRDALAVRIEFRSRYRVTSRAIASACARARRWHGAGSTAADAGASGNAAMANRRSSKSAAGRAEPAARCPARRRDCRS